MANAGYVYATQLQSGAIKIGMGRDVSRASAGKTYGPVLVLAVWPVTAPVLPVLVMDSGAPPHMDGLPGVAPLWVLGAAVQRLPAEPTQR